MAFENPLGTNNLAIFEASTGLPQYTFVTLSTADGTLIAPTSRGVCIGVLVSSGSTGSTAVGTVQSVQCYGVAKVLAASTLINPGDMIGASTTGIIGGAAIVSDSAAAHVLGIALTGNGTTGASGTTDDITGVVSVLLQWMGQASTLD